MSGDEDDKDGGAGEDGEGWEVTNRTIFGDCRDSMRQLITDGVKVQMCVTSPPYWGLRDYGHPGQLGLEPTPAEYVANMVEVFRLVRDLLADDGVLWLNLGDSYTSGGRDKWNAGDNHLGQHGAQHMMARAGTPPGLKPKDLIGIPWRVAFALQADGWYLRCDVVWSKPNPMPESVADRPTKAHEYIFLLSKNERYYYDADAIKEPMSMSSVERLTQPNLENQIGSDRVPGKTNGNMKAVGKVDKQRGHSRRHAGFNDRWDAMEKAEQCSGMRNKRSVWTVATQPYSEAHFATFPPALIEPCILAGSRPGDVVLDPFFGSGTTGQVAQQLGRKWLGCELNEAYAPLQDARTAQQGLELTV